MKVLNKQGQKGIFTKGDNMFLNGKIKEILDYILQLSKIVLVITLTAFMINNWYSYDFYLRGPLTLDMYFDGDVDMSGGIDTYIGRTDEYQKMSTDKRSKLLK